MKQYSCLIQKELFLIGYILANRQIKAHCSHTFNVIYRVMVAVLVQVFSSAPVLLQHAWNDWLIESPHKWCHQPHFVNYVSDPNDSLTQNQSRVRTRKVMEIHCFWMDVICVQVRMCQLPQAWAFPKPAIKQRAHKSLEEHGWQTGTF